MPDPDDTPRSAKIIRDYIVGEMREGFKTVHQRIDAYRGEAQKGNAELRAHVRSCDLRYAQLIKAKTGDATPVGTERLTRKNWANVIGGWMLNRIVERGFDWAIIVVAVLILYALNHGAKIPTP